VIYGPGLVRYPRCAKDLYGWSWEYRRKQRRIIRNRVAVITQHMAAAKPLLGQRRIKRESGLFRLQSTAAGRSSGG